MSKKLLLAIPLILVVMTIIVGIIGFNWLFSPVSSTTAKAVQFVIPRGQSVSQIGQRLHEAGLIRHPLAFRLVVKFHNLGNKLQAGSFELFSHQSPIEIAQSLTMGSEDRWVTIPEGWRVEEIAVEFADFPEFDAKAFIKAAEPKEGHFFPDTYLFPIQVTEEKVRQVMLDRFDEIVEENDIEAKAEARELTLQEVVTLASLVEREARAAKDMKVVAGILHNRLEAGMPLQVDATLQYIKGYNAETKSWWSPPLAADKQRVSPFNTYLNPGIPPSPIANPGLNALLAVVQPTESDYYYYLTAPDGAMYYSATYDEHLANIAKYLK